MDTDILANGIEALAERERGLGMLIGALVVLGVLLVGEVIFPALVRWQQMRGSQSASQTNDPSSSWGRSSRL